jgi:hypothetical protein
MVKVAWAVVTLGRESEFPEIPPRVMLTGTTLAGGFGGLLGKVIVTVTILPRVALPPGATELIAALPPGGV